MAEQAREQAIPPERLIAARRADARECEVAFATARESMEKKELLLAQVRAEVDRLQGNTKTKSGKLVWRMPLNELFAEMEDVVVTPQDICFPDSIEKRIPRVLSLLTLRERRAFQK